MAKKPDPTPPFDDFDPDRILSDEVEPLDDDLIVDPLPDDDLIVDVEEEVVAVEPDDAIVDVDAAVVDEVSADEIDVSDALVTDDELVADSLLDGDVPADVLVTSDEVAADDMLVDPADDLVVDEDLIDAGAVEVEDEHSAHEVETMASMPALDDDDPFAGVGEELEGTGPTGEPGDEELVGAGVVDRGIDEPYVEEEIPKPATHWLTWSLIGLNIVAALAAPYLIVQTLQKRQEYTYAVFRHDLAMMGLPTEEEAKTLTAAKGTLPLYRIAPADIKRIVTERIGPQGDKFGEVRESFARSIPPNMLTVETLKDHFGEVYVDAPEPITTVEAEVRRLEKSVPGLFENAAKASLEAAPSDEVKRARIVRMLHPLAMNTHQSEVLDQTIKDAKGAELDKLYMDAVQRRMAFDFLLPLEMFRPGDAKNLFVETIGDLQKLPLSQVMERVTERLKSTIDMKYQPALHLGEEWGKQDRDTIEKRLSVAFTLLSLAHVKKPDGELLDPKLLERIPLVMGQYDFALACELFPSRVLRLNDLVKERIREDREGFEVADKDGALIRNRSGFIDAYEDELQRNRFMQQDIDKAKLRLADLQEQKIRYQKLLEQRTEQRADVLKKIAKARAKTEQEIAELRRFQEGLFRYQVELATSEEDLARVNQDIEQRLGKKGAKQP